MIRGAERGTGGAICPQGLRGLIIFDILTTGNALKCIFCQSKGRDLKNLLLASPPGPHCAVCLQKALGSPEHDKSLVNHLCSW